MITVFVMKDSIAFGCLDFADLRYVRVLRYERFWRRCCRQWLRFFDELAIRDETLITGLAIGRMGFVLVSGAAL